MDIPLIEQVKIKRGSWSSSGRCRRSWAKRGPTNWCARRLVESEETAMRLRAILLSLGLATAAQAAPELTSFYTTPAGWQVFYHTATRNCGMVREHKMGTNVIVNYEREDDSWTFSLRNNNWHRVVHDQKYHVYLMLDGRERWEGDFTGSIWSGRRICYRCRAPKSSSSRSSWPTTP